MASIFNALHVGYSGLNAAQIGIDTTGHNISNVETEGYTRQRVVTSAATPLSIAPGQRGNGVEVQEIARIFDSFVYGRYTSTSEANEYTGFMRQTLEELSTYFPEIDNVGIKADMQTYYNLWQSFADNPENNAMKIALAQQTMTMSEHIQQTATQVRDLQGEMNEQLKVSIDEVNRVGREIADLNRAIDSAESNGIENANDLRDQRDLLTLSMSKLIGGVAFDGDLRSDISIDSNLAEAHGNFTLSVEGHNIVDGVSFHPIIIDNTDNPEGYYELYYERQDGKRLPIATDIEGGKVGAILDLRGATLNPSSGFPEDGALQATIDELNAYAAGMIEHTNNIYAQSATEKMISNEVNIDGAQPLRQSDLNLYEGTFDVIAYDIDGNETARRTITIDHATTLEGGTGTNSIQAQIEAAVDDNGDGDGTNDIDDIMNFNYSGGNLQLDVKSGFVSQGYTFAIADDTSNGFGSGTNFAGSFGLSRFFEGNDAFDINLDSELRRDPTLISAHDAPVAGNNKLALDMVQMQFENYKFNVNGVEYNDTVYGMYDTVATTVGSKTNSAIIADDATTAQFNAIEQEYFSISKVSVDEELTNLIKYQTSYGAAAKVITTIDQMMDTLLGLKQ